MSERNYIHIRFDLDDLYFQYKRHTWRLDEWIKEAKDQDFKKLCEIEKRVYSQVIKDINEILEKGIKKND